MYQFWSLYHQVKDCFSNLPHYIQHNNAIQSQISELSVGEADLKHSWGWNCTFWLHFSLLQFVIYCIILLQISVCTKSEKGLKLKGLHLGLKIILGLSDVTIYIIYILFAKVRQKNFRTYVCTAQQHGWLINMNVQLRILMDFTGISAFMALRPICVISLLGFYARRKLLCRGNVFYFGNFRSVKIQY